MRVHQFRAMHPNISMIESSNDFFATMGREFPRHQAEGKFQEMEDEAMFVYQIKNRGRKHRGIINNTEIQDFKSGKILLHEQTIPTKEEVLVDTSIERGAMIKPILLFHKKNAKLSKLIEQVIENEEAAYSVELAGGIVHTLWKISDTGRIDEVKNIFTFGIAKAFVADGHHRYRASFLLHQNDKMEFQDLDFGNILTAYFSEEEVDIFDHSKMVEILDTVDKEAFIEQLSEYASIRSIPKFSHPESKREFVVLVKGEIYKGKWKKKTLKDFEISPDALDNYIMNQIVFRTILQIPDVRLDSRISFFSSNERGEGIVKRSEENPTAICVVQAPLSISDVKQYSTKKKNLPPKSTWFEPRIKSGVIAQKF